MIKKHVLISEVLNKSCEIIYEKICNGGQTQINNLPVHQHKLHNINVLTVKIRNLSYYTFEVLHK